MFTYKFDFGAGLITATPIVNGSISRVLQPNEIFDRFQCDASFTFYGDDYDTIINDRDVNGNTYFNLLIYQSSSLILTVFIDSFGQEFADDKKIILKVKSLSDDYTAILKNLDNDFNILNIEDRYSIKTSTFRIKLEFSLTAFTTPTVPVGSLFTTITNTDFGSTVTQNIYARQNYTAVSTLERDLFISNGWSLLSGNTVVKDWVGEYDTLDQSTQLKKTYGILFGTSPSPFPSRVINEQYPDASEYLSDWTLLWYLEGTYLGSYTERYTYWLLNKEYYGSGEVIYNNARKFRDVIQALILNADSSITFDSSGSSTDSFHYFENLATLNMMFQGITDTLLNDSGNINTIPSTVLNLNLNDVFEFLKQRFKVYWRIDNGIFRFVHLRANYSKSATTKLIQNTTNYKGINWSHRLNNVTFDYKEQYDRVKRSELAYGVDFLGVDIIYPTVLQKNLLQINNTKFHVDIQDIFRRPARYSRESLTECVLLDVETAESDNLISYFQNDATLPFNTLNGATIGAGAIIDLPLIESLRHNSAQGYIFSNEFSVAKGDTIIFEMDVTAIIGTVDHQLAIVILDYSLNSFPVPILFAYTNISADGIASVSHTFTESNSNVRVRFNKNTGTDSSVDLSDISITNDRLHKIISATGALSGLTVPNGALALANCDSRDFTGASARDVIINNSSVTIDVEDVIRFKSQEDIKVPSTNILTDFDFSQYVETELGTTLVLQEVSVELDNKFTTIKTKL